MQWRKNSIDDAGDLSIPASWLHLHYYEALTVLFRVENALRLFVYLVLKEQYGDKWQNLEISSDDESKTTIAACARRRIEQGKTFGYLTYPIQSPLMHMTSGELVRLIIHDSYWPVFKDYFYASRNVVTLKLQEIGTVRNAMAHFRPLSQNDVEVVKQNANQMLSNVERTLMEIIQCSNIVPSNTPDEWYTRCRTLGAEHTTVSFSQSKDEQWIRITLTYTPVIVAGKSALNRDYQSYRVTNVDTPAILETQNTLRGHVLLVTESVTLASLTKELLPRNKKHIHFTFSNQNLRNKHTEIRDCLETLLGELTSETELLHEDQLAKGKLIQLTKVTSRKTAQGSWSITGESLRSPSPERELPEYWGNIYGVSDFISDTDGYPWMPVKIADEGDSIGVRSCILMFGFLSVSPRVQAE